MQENAALASRVSVVKEKIDRAQAEKKLVNFVHKAIHLAYSIVPNSLFLRFHVKFVYILFWDHTHTWSVTTLTSLW